MNREIPFEEEKICEYCGSLGSFDFLGEYFCPDCAEKYQIYGENNGESDKNYDAG